MNKDLEKFYLIRGLKFHPKVDYFHWFILIALRLHYQLNVQQMTDLWGKDT